MGGRGQVNGLNKAFSCDDMALFLIDLVLRIFLIVIVFVNYLIEIS